MDGPPLQVRPRFEVVFYGVVRGWWRLPTHTRTHTHTQSSFSLSLFLTLSLFPFLQPSLCLSLSVALLFSVSVSLFTDWEHHNVSYLGGKLAEFPSSPYWRRYKTSVSVIGSFRLNMVGTFIFGESTLFSVLLPLFAMWVPLIFGVFSFRNNFGCCWK